VAEVFEESKAAAGVRRGDALLEHVGFQFLETDVAPPRKEKEARIPESRRRLDFKSPTLLVSSKAGSDVC
jgi:hypothetical protein